MGKIISLMTVEKDLKSAIAQNQVIYKMCRQMGSTSFLLFHETFYINVNIDSYVSYIALWIISE